MTTVNVMNWWGNLKVADGDKLSQQYYQKSYNFLTKKEITKLYDITHPPEPKKR